MKNENVLINTENKPAEKGFRTNILVLVLSVLVAVFLWVYVMSVDAPNSERTIYGVKVSVNNIEKLNQQSGLSIVSENANIYIDVVLQGKKSVLGKLTPEDIKAYVDASTITEAGTHSLEIKYMPFPGGTTFISASSGTVSMVIDSTATVEIPINVKFANCIIPTGYSLGDYVLNTEYVSVTGARSDLEKIESATISINTGTLTKSITVRDEVPVLCDKNGKEVVSEYITYKKEYVDVYVPVYLTRELTVKVNYLHGLYNDKNTTLTLSPSKVTVKGDASAVEALGDSIVVGTINEKSNVNSFTFEITKKMLGDGVSLEASSPLVFASVAHNGVETTEFLVDKENFKVNNPYNLEYSIDQDGVVIKFRCSTEQLIYCNEENVKVYLDLSGIRNGEEKARVKLSIHFEGELKGSYELASYYVDVSFEN